MIKYYVQKGEAMLGKVNLISYPLLYHDFSKCSNENQNITSIVVTPAQTSF